MLTDLILNSTSLNLYTTSLYFTFNANSYIFHIMQTVSTCIKAVFFFSRQTPSQLQMNLKKREAQHKSQVKKLPNRDLAAKYYGKFLDPNETFKFNL